MRYLRNQSGLSTMLALFIMAFAGIIVAGLTPMVTTQLKLTSINKNLVEAQFVAEAGAKRAIVAIANERTDWDWLNNDSHNSFDGSEDKYYIVNIDPPIDPFSAPEPGSTYTITSEGHVADSKKTVTVNVKTGSQGGGGIYNNYSAFSNGAITFNGGPVQITGDIASNTSIDLHTTAIDSISGYAYAPSGMVKANKEENIEKITAGKAQVISNQGTIDIPNPAFLMPENPTDFSKTGTNITETWTSGQWGGHIYQLTQPAYYYEGDYYLNGHSYVIPDGKTVTIYIRGKFTLYAGTKITGGNITIHATNGFDFSGGYIDAGSNGTVNLYTNEDLLLNNSSSYIKGSAVTIYANTGVPINGGYIDTGSNGTVNLYTNGSLSLTNSGTYINGSIVNIIAQNRVYLNSGSVNKSLSGAVTKIYTKDFKMDNASSVMSGNGVGLVMATHNIELSGGTARTTLMIAGNYIEATNFGVTVGGLYSNGTIFISGVKVLHSDAIAPALNLSPGSGPGSDFSVISWTN